MRDKYYQIREYFVAPEPIHEPVEPICPIEPAQPTMTFKTNAFSAISFAVGFCLLFFTFILGLILIIVSIITTYIVSYSRYENLYNSLLREYKIQKEYYDNENNIYLEQKEIYDNEKLRYDNRPTDSQMDTWFREDINSTIKKNALKRLGLDENELVKDILIIPGPIYWKIHGIEENEMLRRKGLDGDYRYSIWNIEILMLTENHVSSFGCTYHWINNAAINEWTNEYFYKDIASVKTSRISSTNRYLKEGQKLEYVQIFKLINLSGDSIKVITNNTELKVSSSITSEVEKAVQVIRVMLRSKKNEHPEA